MIDDVPLAPLHDRLGITLVEVSGERVLATMPVSGNTQPAGLLHGGATAALIEGAASVAAWCYAQPDRQPVGVDLNVTHLRPVATGQVTAEATAVRLGRSTAVYAVEVRNGDGQVSALGRLTCQLLPVKP